MGFTKRFVAAAAVATIAAGALAGPAAAHGREFKWVYSASTSDTEIRAQAELSTGKHPGTMRMTLKKKVDGEWKFVARGRRGSCWWGPPATRCSRWSGAEK